MEYILNNEQLTVTFTTKGGTICSIEDSQGIEYLWQGDACLLYTSNAADE